MNSQLPTADSHPLAKPALAVVALALVSASSAVAGQLAEADVSFLAAVRARLGAPSSSGTAELRRLALAAFTDGAAPVLLTRRGTVSTQATTPLTALRFCFADAMSLVPYQDALPMMGGTPPYKFRLMPGFDRLPAGLTFDPNTCTIGGTPLDDKSLPILAPLTVLVRDAAGTTIGVLTRLRVVDPFAPLPRDPACPPKAARLAGDHGPRR